MGEAARRSAQRYAWPRVADQVTEVYERAIAAPRPADAGERFAHWAGLRPADGGPRRPAQKLPSLDPAPVARATADAASPAEPGWPSPPCSASA